MLCFNSTWQLATNYLLVQVSATLNVFIIDSVSFLFLVTMFFILKPLMFCHRLFSFINSVILHFTENSNPGFQVISHFSWSCSVTPIPNETGV